MFWRLVLCVTLLCFSSFSGVLMAWGLEVHRLITARAIDLLPPDMQPFYQKHRMTIVEHSIDPDLWRNAGFSDEPPRHFLDLDAFGAYPFSSLPRDYHAAVRKFGVRRLQKEGLLPWRTAEIYEKLLQAFQRQKEGRSPYSLDDIKFFSSVISHYVSDAHVPFHATSNYDGQLTQQDGIHFRFETELVLRNWDRINLQPQPLYSVVSARDTSFENLLQSFQAVRPILEADRKAIQGRSEYDDAYYESLFEQTHVLLEKQLNQAAASVASHLVSAWEAAGKPSLPTDPPARVHRVLRPKK
ncbi:MAG: hypothetical protein AB1898_15640 [Acidobacteriota bacterium]